MNGRIVEYSGKRRSQEFEERIKASGGIELANERIQGSGMDAVPTALTMQPSNQASYSGSLLYGIVNMTVICHFYILVLKMIIIGGAAIVGL